MGLREDILQATRTGVEPGGMTKCKLVQIVESFEEPARAELLQLLDDRGVSGARMTVWLKKQGHQISAAAIGNHRIGTCACR